jgi:hypothetical protein
MLLSIVYVSRSQSATTIQSTAVSSIARTDAQAKGTTQEKLKPIRESSSSQLLTETYSGSVHERPSLHLHRGSLKNNDDDDGGHQFLWQTRGLESSSSSSHRAILFLAHGCGHAMTDWWDKDNNGEICPECIGLPEERAIVHMALDVDLVVVAMSSLDRRGSKCWSTDDGPVVAKVLKQIQADFGQIPILAFGASSGGSFVSTILGPFLEQANTTLAGYISQIAAPQWPSNIPTVVITMNRDAFTDAAAAAAVQELADRKVPVRHIRLPPRPVTADFFAKRIHSVNADSSSQMVQALHDAGMLSDDGMLTEDPRRSNWRRVLAPVVLATTDTDTINDSLIADRSPIAEVLNVAWGMHEMTRDGVPEALAFLLEQLSA